jgi:hypothetical protein
MSDDSPLLENRFQVEKKVINKPLLNALKRYERAVTSLLKHWNSLSDAQHRFQPGNGKWGLDAVFSHLMDVERLTLKSMNQRVKSGKYRRPAFKHHRRYALLSLSLILPKKFKAPSVVVEIATDIDASQIQKTWQMQLLELHLFIESLSWQQHANLLFKHPHAGALTAKQTLGFLYWHLIHHLRQIDAIKRHPAFPYQ